MKHLYTGLILVLTAASAGGQSLMDSLVAHYPFNGHTQDISGNNNHLTNSGAIPAPGLDGSPNTAYRFNGTSSYMSNTTEGALRPPTYTWAFWMKIDQLPANGDFSIVVNAGGGDRDQVFQVANNYQGYNGVNAFGYNKHSGISDTAISDTAMPGQDTASWNFYTVSRGLDSVRLFINGTWVHSAYTGDTAGYSGADLGFYLGARQGGQNFFNGRLDDLWVWSTALTRAQIDTLYGLVLTSVPPAPAGGDVVIYPNPSPGRITIEPDFAVSGIFLFDTLGREISTGKQQDGTNEVVFQLSPGTYFLRICDEQNRVVQKKVVVY